MYELLRRQIDSDRKVGQLEPPLPARQLPARCFDYPLTGRMNQAAAFENGQEAGGW